MTIRRALITRLARLEQVERGSQTPTLRIFIHGGGCREIDPCADRCEWWAIVPGVGIQREREHLIRTQSGTKLTKSTS